MQCEMEITIGFHKDCQSVECGSSDAVRECADCGRKLCRKHNHYCAGCDQNFCEWCLEWHQTNEPHIPEEDIRAA